MTLAEISHCACRKCGDVLDSPEWSYAFSEERLIIDLWSCMNCGNQFETESLAHAGSKEKIDDGALSVPSLLAA